MRTSEPRIGRNDPCPCGSGKKYKKCCLDKSAQIPNTEVPEVVEPRFRSPVNGYYTQGALMEAFTPGGTVRIHPYVLIKLRDDPALRSVAAPEDRAQLLRMWRPSRLAVMPIEEIESKLGLHGVNYDRVAFIETARQQQSAWTIAEKWGAGLAALIRPERDFLGLAACELWRRLCPETPSLEMIDDWLCEGYGLIYENKRAEGLDAWWKVWEALRQRIGPDMRNLSEAGELLFNRMSQCLSNWATDFCIEALNGSTHDFRCGELGIRFILDLLLALPEEEEHLNYRMDLATIYFQLGRDGEGEQVCKDLIEKHPDSASGYVVLSDSLLPNSKTVRDVGKIQRAISLLEQARQRPVTDGDDFDLEDRIARTRALLPGGAQPVRS